METADKLHSKKKFIDSDLIVTYWVPAAIGEKITQQSYCKALCLVWDTDVNRVLKMRASVCKKSNMGVHWGPPKDIFKVKAEE